MDAAVKASAWRAPVSVPALLDLVLAILLLLAIACVVQWRSADTFRKILPVAATGSPAAANFDPRSENPINTLFNRYGDFAAEDAGGMGRIVYDFGEPRAFNTVSHHYRMPAPDPWYHITAITVAVSADGLTWTDVAREETSSRAWMEAITERMVDERQAARLDASRIVLDTQHAVASRYWRLTASGSGAHRIDIFGQVQFMPDLSTVERIPLEAFAVLFGLACYRAARRLNITWGRAAAIASACAVSALLIVLALGFAPHWLLLTQDSATYISYTLDGSISPWVPSGYPRFVALVSALFGLSAMPTVQVLMLCIGMAIGAILLFEHSAVAPYVFLVGFLAVCGGIILYAFTALTEVMFAAGLVLATAALAVAIDRPAKAAFALVGLGLTLTLLAKSAAPILIAGACLALRYLPLAAWRSFALLAILPPSVVLLATYAEIYARTGDTSQLGPIALVGQVAAYADPDAVLKNTDRGSAELRELEARVGQIARPLAGSRPYQLEELTTISELDAFVDQTSNTYGVTLAATMATIDAFLAERYPERYVGPILLSENRAWRNGYLTRLSLAIAADNRIPLALYAGAHFYGLWRDLGREGFFARNSLTLLPGPADACLYVRANAPIADSMVHPVLLEMVRTHLPARPTAADALAASAKQRVVPQLLDHHSEDARLLFKDYCAWIGVACIAVALLWLIPHGGFKPLAGAVMAAILIDAYFLAHAMFQVTLARYSSAVLPAVLVFAALTVSGVWRIVVDTAMTIRDEIRDFLR